MRPLWLAAVILGLVAALAVGAGVSSYHNRPRWLKCALHCHTRASDGSMAREAVLEEYAREGYDVVAITDHGKWSPAGHWGKILLIPGCEFTLYGPYHHEVHIGSKSNRVRILAHPYLATLPIASS